MNKKRESLELVKQSIRGVGLRATPARIAILQLLIQSPSPLTHAEVLKRLASTGIDGATVFRNLNGLAQADVLRKIEVGDHVWRFEAIAKHSHEREAHPHFLCVDCGTVTCLNAVSLTAGSRKETAQVGQVTEILMRGHCNACR